MQTLPRKETLYSLVAIMQPLSDSRTNPKWQPIRCVSCDYDHTCEYGNKV